CFLFRMPSPFNLESFLFVFRNQRVIKHAQRNEAKIFLAANKFLIEIVDPRLLDCGINIGKGREREDYLAATIDRSLKNFIEDRSFTFLVDPRQVNAGSLKFGWARVGRLTCNYAAAPTTVNKYLKIRVVGFINDLVTWYKRGMILAEA